ncbi:MAG: DUF4232 domain-containing protein [Streptosporangiaceae bacterium]
MAGPTAAGSLAVACALVLAACASTSASSAAPPTASSTGVSAKTTTAAPSGAPGGSDECTASQLKITLTDTGAVAGQAGGFLKFSNDTAASCRMTGWPAVTALTAAGKATPLRHAESAMFGAWQRVTPAPVLTLGPGEAAYAVVAADDQPAGSNPGCPAPYVRLHVSPPGTSASVVISAWLPGARSYLPACTSVSGSPTAEISTITPLSSLAH